MPPGKTASQRKIGRASHICGQAVVYPYQVAGMPSSSSAPLYRTGNSMAWSQQKHGWCNCPALLLVNHLVKPLRWSYPVWAVG